MTDDIRLVPVTREQKLMLVAIGVTLQPILGQHLEALVAAWDAAPAEPAKVLTTELLRQLRARYPGVQIGDVIATTRSLRDDARSILGALGLPRAE